MEEDYRVCPRCGMSTKLIGQSDEFEDNVELICGSCDWREADTTP